MGSEIEVAQKIVDEAIKRGFDEAATVVTSSKRVMVKIANSEPTVIQHWTPITIELYLTKDGRVFVGSYEPKSLDELLNGIDRIQRIALKVAESQLYAPLPEPVPVKLAEGLFDTRILKAMDSIDRLSERIIEVAHREEIDSIAGMLQLNYVREALVTSKGTQLSEDKTALQGYVRAFAEPDGSGQWCFTSTKYDVSGLEEMASIAARYAVDSKNRVDIEPGIYDVILSPMVFGNLLEYIVDMTSAFSVLMGLSMFMNNEVGNSVSSEKLTIIDEPRTPELPNASSFDFEGLETYNKPIIEDGVLRTLLHNTKTAKMMDVKSTANAGWIKPNPWNIVVKPGDAKLDEIISSVRRGLLITNNWYTRMQSYVDGLFSTVARDAIFYVENGRIVRPINKIRIADSFLNILKNIEHIGKELYNIQWWEVSTPSKIPYVLIRNIRISKHII
ncbi:MAG: TldD/PmbA family protein [Ignisphaera sp.]|nr:TldD/PmbA family protein [Ignisphaera sp.]MCX8167726.1 TldD/PmbA family protein [Ignisphaera sp.]MDW8085290.1 TldD/PmbA family protein [Ignisphaera sp.]